MLEKSCRGRTTWPSLLAIAIATLVGCGGGAFETSVVAQGGGGAPRPDAAISGGAAGVGGSLDASVDAVVDADPCPPRAVTCAGKCGQVSACSTVVDCGGCPTGQTCGGGGANVCGIKPCVRDCTGKACGASDGCDGVCATGACGTGQLCTEGVCRCDAASCTGCCSGDQCVAGTNDAACGLGGKACIACTGLLSCAGGGQPGACGCTPNCQGAACGAKDGCGGVCSTGTCAAGLHCTGTVCVCDTSSCSGCCSSTGQCSPGTAPDACGTGGLKCAVCTGDCTTARVCGPCSPKVELLYMPQSTSDPVGQVAPYFQIVNKAGCPLDVSQLKVRYYFTNEATAANPLVYACDYISLGSAAATFVTISPARTGANKYLELSFANGSLAPGATLTVQNRFHDQAYSVQFTQSNDYSYDPSKLAYTTWDHVTAFAGGVLVWGREP